MQDFKLFHSGNKPLPVFETEIRNWIENFVNANSYKITHMVQSAQGELVIMIIYEMRNSETPSIDF